MVTVTNYILKKNSEGKEFYSLELTGDLDFGISSTGKSYATAKKCSVSSSFDEQTCKAMFGRQMPGCIIKVSTEPYEFKVPKTGEVKVLDYKYEYSPEEILPLSTQTQLQLP